MRDSDGDRDAHRHTDAHAEAQEDAAMIRCLLALLACLLSAPAQAQTPTPTPANWSILIAIGDSIMTGTRLLSDALPTPPDPTSQHLHLQGNDGVFHDGFVEPYKCESASRCGPACGTPACGNQLSVFPYAASLDPAILPCLGINNCPCSGTGGILYGPGQAAGMTLLSFGVPEVDVIPCAKGGQLSSDWLPGSNLYNSCVAREVVAATRGQPYCVMVDLGTNDAGFTGNPNTTATNLEQLFAGLRGQWGANIPIVFWEISTAPGFNLANFPNRDLVLAQQQSIPAAPFLTRLSSLTIPLGCDGVHPTTAGYRMKGQMAAQACATLAPITPQFTPTAATPTPTVTPTPAATCNPFSCGACPAGP